MIELRAVSKAFGSQSVLKDISMKVDPGQRWCIIGQSGSGKSVTMKLMTGLLEADAGEVLIDGKNTAAFSNKQWGQVLQHFGVVFQSAALFSSIDVFENVGIRLLEERSLPLETIREKVAAALASVGLKATEVMHKFPSELSGGMQKRVGIARAIVHEPSYLFFDEPTTGLDPISAGLIDELMMSLSQKAGRTTLIITHDMYTVRTIATHVLFIHDKGVHFTGSPEALFASQDPVIQSFLARKF